MDKKTSKRATGYLSNVIREIGEIIDAAHCTDDLKGGLTKFVSKRILESYKNGIEAGMKKAGRD